MNPNELINQAQSKLAASVSRFSEELKKLRTGRAHTGMLDGVMVTAYGQPMPLIQVASLATPEPQLLQITPFDPANLQAISAAIREDQSLGLNPVDDGRVVRVQIPPLNEERRREIVKQLNQKAEDCMISMRQTRQDVIKQLDEAKKDHDISEDDHKRLQKQLEDLMAAKKAELDKLSAAKEQEIMTV